MTGSSSPAPRFGGYQVLGRIGIGGMGEVFRAVAQEGGARVALKLMRPEHASSEHHRRMFTAEAEVGVRLEHRNIVRVIDHGQVGETPYIAFELIEGVSLDRVLDAGPLEPRLAAYVAVEVLAALEYAHERGLVHRDVSATNVLLSTAGEVKLADFGVVKVRGLSLTRTNEIKGKPAYMAPEQLRAGAGREIDGRVDVFAVGVLLHRMLEGRGPFTDVAEWLMGGARLDVKGPFQPVLAGALAVLPDRRFPTAEALARAVQRAARPAGDAAARLEKRVRAMMKTERPLQAIDRLIIAEFAESSSHVTSPPTGERPRLTLLRGGARREPDEPDTQPHRRSLGSPDSFDDLATSPRHFPLLVMPSAPVLELATPDPEAHTPARPAPGWRKLLRGIRRVHVLAALIAAIAVCNLRLLTHSPPATPTQTQMQTQTQTQPQKRPQTKPQTTAQTPAPTRPSAPTAPAPRPALAMPPEPVTLRPDSPPHKPRPSAPPPRGWLTLDSEPWATVYLGARKLGTTPFAHVPVPSGRVQLTLDLENSGRRRPLAVKIAPTAETRLTVRPR